MRREVEPSADALHELGRGEGRRAPAICASRQHSPGLNIPGELMGKEPSARELLYRDLQEETPVAGGDTKAPGIPTQQSRFHPWGCCRVPSSP